MQLKTKNATFATQSNPYQNMRYNPDKGIHPSGCIFLSLFMNRGFETRGGTAVITQICRSA